MIKAQDKMIARRADTKARTDLATWKMMAKLNGASSLPDDALAFLSSYRNFLETMPETEASEATIGLMYKNYYAEMGGTGTPPDIKSVPKDPIVELDNVTAFKRPAPQQPQTVNSGTTARPRLPVALIFILLIVIYVGIRYYLLR
ncbi:hypothetical protein V4R08_06270 [Nitrobacter sp. NHB1]|uniref:hypothetical protein n=1 Tax=Nitrobacter sp. NHB1 TaxID=3119830 RepID=UPI002FFE83E9